MAKSHFPTYMHVKHEGAGTEEAYFLARIEAAELVEDEEVVEIACYKLVEVRRAKRVVKFED